MKTNNILIKSSQAYLHRYPLFYYVSPFLWIEFLDYFPRTKGTADVASAIKFIRWIKKNRERERNSGRVGYKKSCISGLVAFSCYSRNVAPLTYFLSAFLWRVVALWGLARAYRMSLFWPLSSFSFVFLISFNSISLVVYFRREGNISITTFSNVKLIIIYRHRHGLWWSFGAFFICWFVGLGKYEGDFLCKHFFLWKSKSLALESFIVRQEYIYFVQRFFCCCCSCEKYQNQYT